MRLFGHHRHHVLDPFENAPPWTLELDAKLQHILEVIMTDYAKLTADITAQTTVLQGVATAAAGLNAANAEQAQQITDLKAALAAAGATDPAVQAAVDKLDASVQGNTALVAGLVPAVTVNTPTPPADATAAAATAAAPPAA